MPLGGKPKVVKPPALPAKTETTDIAMQAMKVGEAERKRLRRQRGRPGTVLTQGILGPAKTQQASLKQKLG